MTINQNTTKINTIKNTTLPELLQKINSLPDAGAGGGSAVETCTVTVSFTGNATGYGEFGDVKYQYAKVVSGGTEMVQGIMNADNMVFSDVLANSMFLLYIFDIGMFACTPTNSSKYKILDISPSNLAFLVGTEPATIVFS